MNYFSTKKTKIEVSGVALILIIIIYNYIYIYIVFLNLDHRSRECQCLEAEVVLVSINQTYNILVENNSKTVNIIPNTALLLRSMCSQCNEFSILGI